MKVHNIWLIVFIMLLFCGCQQTDMGDDSVLLNDSGIDLSEELYCEKETQSSLTDETEESVESIETAGITEADVYEATQRMIEELDEDFFVKPEEFGKTMYTDDKFEEIKQYEVNMIFNIGKEEREYKYGTHTSYEQSIWVICRKEQEGYKVKEIIPMRLRE